MEKQFHLTYRSPKGEKVEFLKGVSSLGADVGWIEIRNGSRFSVRAMNNPVSSGEWEFEDQENGEGSWHNAPTTPAHVFIAQLLKAREGEALPPLPEGIHVNVSLTTSIGEGGLESLLRTVIGLRPLPR